MHSQRFIYKLSAVQSTLALLSLIEISIHEKFCKISSQGSSKSLGNKQLV